MTDITFPGSAEGGLRLGFGAMGLGGLFGAQDDATMVRSVLYALEQGVTFIDTARAYGRSEELVGRALREWRGARPFVATKVQAAAMPSYPAGAGFHFAVPAEAAFPSGSIRASTEGSLRALGLDTIDLLQMHQYWPQWDDAAYWMDDLLRLQDEGKVRHIGVSLPDHRHDLGIALVRSGKIRSVQTIVNIFDSLAFDSLVPVCQQNRVAVIARVILDESGLTGFLAEDTVIPETDYRHRYFDCLPRKVYIDRVNRLRAFVPEHAESLPDLAIRFVLTHPGVTVALTSMQVLAYAAENIASARRPPLSSDAFEALRIQHRWVKHFYHQRRWM